MNLSIETKLATALGASLVALVLAAMAQTQNDSGTAGSNDQSNQYALTDNPALTNPSREGFGNSPSPGTPQEDARTFLSNKPGQVPASSNREKSSKSSKDRSGHALVDHSYHD